MSSPAFVNGNLIHGVPAVQDDGMVWWYGRVGRGGEIPRWWDVAAISGEGAKFTFGHCHARWVLVQGFLPFCCLLVWGDISSRV